MAGEERGGREGLTPGQDGRWSDGRETTHIQKDLQCHTTQQQLPLQLHHHDDGGSCDNNVIIHVIGTVLDHVTTIVKSSLEVM